MRAPGHAHTLLALVVTVLAVNFPVGAVELPVINGTFPPCVRLVASDGVQGPQHFGGFEVIVQDIALNPWPGAAVRVDFGLVPELRIAGDQNDPEAIVDCAGKSVTKITDMDGRAVFCIIGSNIPGAPAATLIGGGRIFVNGFVVASPTANAFDLDGTSGVGAGDMAVFLQDFSTGLPIGRCDFDCSGSIGAGDLSLWLVAFSSGTQVVSAVSCP